MKSFIKKQSVSFYFSVLALPLLLVGTIYMIHSSTMTAGNRLGNLPLLIIAMVVSMAGVVLDIWAANRKNDKGYLSLVGKMASIACAIYVVGSVLNARVMMIAGLFTYNRGYKEGWAVYNASLVCFVCLLIAVLLLIIGAFFRTVRKGSKSKKNKKAANTAENPAQ